MGTERGRTPPAPDWASALPADPASHGAWDPLQFAKQLAGDPTFVERFFPVSCQEDKPFVVGSILCCVLGCLSPQQVRDAVEATGLEFLWPQDHLDSRLLTRFLRSDLLSACRANGVIPIKTEGRATVVFASCSPNRLSAEVGRAQLGELARDALGLSAASTPALRVVFTPHAVVQNFLDTWELLVTCGGRRKVPSLKPAPRADSSQPPGAQPKPWHRDPRRIQDLVDTLAEQALVLGSNRLARRVLRAIETVTRPAPEDPYELEASYREFLRDFLGALFVACVRTRPIIPDLYVFPFPFRTRMAAASEELPVGELHQQAKDLLDIAKEDHSSVSQAVDGLLEKQKPASDRVRVSVFGVSSALLRSQTVKTLLRLGLKMGWVKPDHDVRKDVFTPTIRSELFYEALRRASPSLGVVSRHLERDGDCEGAFLMGAAHQIVRTESGGGTDGLYFVCERGAAQFVDEVSKRGARVKCVIHPGKKNRWKSIMDSSLNPFLSENFDQYVRCLPYHEVVKADQVDVLPIDAAG